MPLHHVVDGGAGERVVLVHGFTQTLAAMEPLATRLRDRHELVRVDLPGHGGSTPPLVGFAKAAALLGEAGGAAAYLGYSLGGRLCLRLALDRPELVRALVLVGASPGIQDPAARAERRAADEALAAAVERDGVAAFLDRWPAGPPGWPIPLRAWPPPSGCSAPAPRSRSGSGWPACNRRSSSWPGPWTPSSPPLPPRWRSRSALARTPRCCPAP